MQLTTDKQARKQRPIARGVMDYFPLALAEIANVSYVGNQQHNPGQDMHWDRSKSSDHADCVARHLIERGTVDDDGLRHSAKAAWRSLALLEEELEKSASNPLAQFITHEEIVEKLRPANDMSATVYDRLIAMDCPAMTARQIVGGSYLRGNDNARDCKTPAAQTVYVAGPMRGYEKFNFPAFDQARSKFFDIGFNVISPADIDRFTNPTGAEDTNQDVSDQTKFVLRDFWAIFYLARTNASKTNGIVLLAGWPQSTGAAAEFFLARWLGLKIYRPDGREYPLPDALLDFALAWCVPPVVQPEPKRSEIIYRNTMNNNQYRIHEGKVQLRRYSSDSWGESISYTPATFKKAIVVGSFVPLEV